MIYMNFDVAFHFFLESYILQFFYNFFSNLTSSKVMKGNPWPSIGKD